MTFEIGKEYHGFLLYDRQKVEMNDVDMFYFEHRKSGAKLVYLAAPDKEKSFSITFRTYSLDDTGVAHVLEHSVLRGSRKYKTRHPLKDFVKRTNRSKCNACTGADFTRFHVISSERKEFFQLIDMMMDAVFYPQVRENESIFLQEAWRYEADEEFGKLGYNGVIYNEMQLYEGNLRVLAARETDKVMFPKTHYAHCAGGKCASIVKLNHSDVVNFHEKYYKADNSLICLSGKLDLGEYLEFFDREYLSSFERTGNSYEAPVEVKLPGCKRYAQLTYPVLKENGGSDTVLHILSFYMPKDLSAADIWALNTVFTYLSDAGKGVITDALESKGINADVGFGNCLKQKYPSYDFYVYVKNYEEITEIEKQVYAALSDVLEKGIDTDYLACKRNSILFEDRTTVSNDDYSDFSVSEFCNTNWLYGRESVSELNESDNYEWLRSDIAKEYYANIVKTYLLDNPNVAIVSSVPVASLSEEDCARACDSGKQELVLSARELEEYSEKLKALWEWQSGELDEAFNYYEVKDRQEEASAKREAEVLDDDGYIFVKQATSGIVYAEWWFDISGLDSELIPYIHLHNLVMWNCDSANITAQQKSLEGQKYFGEIKYDVEEDSEGRRYFKLKLHTLEENFGKAIDFFAIISADVGNILPSELQEYITNIVDVYTYKVNYESMDLACKRVEYGLRPVENCLDVLNTSNFLATLDIDNETTLFDIITKLVKVNEGIFKNSGYKFGYSCDEDVRADVRSKIDAFNASLGTAEQKESKVVAVKQLRNEGIIISGEEHALAFGVDLSVYPHVSMFAIDALVNVLEYDYLYEKIRVEGGAYTCGAECFGNYLLLYSQRDPDIGRTYEVFKSVPEWLETVEFTQADIVQQTEGVAERFDLLNRTKGEILSSAIFRTIHKIKEDDVPKVMKCITDVKLEEVKNIVPLLKEAFKNSVVCAVSNEEEIKSNASLFDEIIDLRIGK